MFIIDQGSSRPIYQQLVQAIKEHILRGLLQPGDRLPSVRELSAQLRINPNTIQKAYQELERQKVTETLQSRGTFVNSNYKPNQDEESMDLITEEFKRIIIDAHYLGLDENKIVTIIKEICVDLQAGGISHD